MLADIDEALFWPNATGVLGLSGKAEWVGTLVAFIEGSGQTGWTPPMLRARSSGLVALGYLVHESGGNEQALDYLLASADPQVWTRQDAAWIDSQPDAERLRVNLSTSALLGLTLSAAERLREVAGDGTPGARLRETAASVVAEADAIRANGLAWYYDPERR